MPASKHRTVQKFRAVIGCCNKAFGTGRNSQVQKQAAKQRTPSVGMGEVPWGVLREQLRGVIAEIP
jgi:hypothetical protein